MESGFRGQPGLWGETRFGAPLHFFIQQPRGAPGTVLGERPSQRMAATRTVTALPEVLRCLFLFGEMIPYYFLLGQRGETEVEADALASD